MKKNKYLWTFAVAALILAQLACSIDLGIKPAPTATPVPLSATPVPPTVTPVPTQTLVPPTPGPTQNPCKTTEGLLYFVKAVDITKSFMAILDETWGYIPTDPKMAIDRANVQKEHDAAVELLAKQKALVPPPVFAAFHGHRVKAMEAFVSATDSVLKDDRISMAAYFQIMINEETDAQNAAKDIDKACGFDQQNSGVTG